jgi:hypothetical protein
MGGFVGESREAALLEVVMLYTDKGAAGPLAWWKRSVVVGWRGEGERG